MAAASSTQVPRLHHFELVEGMRLQINVTGSSNGRNVRVEFQLKNCSRMWILHWGCIYRGNMNWVVPADHPSGTKNYKKTALQTPFMKSGEVYTIIIELRDPKIHAIEFVLKDGGHDKWLKLKHGNFRIEIPESGASTSHTPIPKDLIENRAYTIWESKGKPVSSPQQQEQDFDAALRELQSQLSKGNSLNELQSSSQTSTTKTTAAVKEQPKIRTPHFYHGGHDVGQWVQKHSEGHAKNTSLPYSALMDLVEKSMGGDNVIMRRSYNAANYEIVVLWKIVSGEYHILVAANMTGSTVLHWGVSKSSPGEWLAPPPEMLPEKSKLVAGACQTYFTDMSTGKGFFQFVDINLQQRNLLGIQFVIWSGGSWIKNNGANFVIGLRSIIPSGKAVHSGIDLEYAIDTCLGFSSKGLDSVSAIRGNSKLKDCLNFIKAHIGDKNIGPLMEKLLESRIELRPFILKSNERSKDLLFLDLALDSALKTTVERGLSDLDFAQLPDITYLVSLVLQNLCLSTINNEDLVYCTKDWYRICESCKPNDVQWALQTKAILDRIRVSLADRSHYYQKKIQPSVQYLGSLLAVEKWVIDSFTEELTRSGSAASLSTLVNRLDSVLRSVANLGCWQVISPVEVCGFVSCVNELIATQDKVFKRPTIVIANRVSGEEEIPNGVVGVLTPDMPDVLSHVSIRARNSKVCFATCFDQNILRNLKLKEGKAISICLKSTNLIISNISSSNLSLIPFISTSIPRGFTFRKNTFCGKYAISIEEFASEMVGAKSCNIQFIRGKVPSWVKVPMSVALPFGVFEAVLYESVNMDLASKISCMYKHVCGGDLSKLKSIQETVLQLKAPFVLTNELKSKMRSSRIPWPGDESEERWNLAWHAIKKVWASKWNERAYISCRKANMTHGNICMAVLIQEVIRADYAFVIHTKNPVSGDSSEIYAEIVKGLGETLVGTYPGRAMSFITKKNNLKSPIVIGYPSKRIGLYSKQSIIFRSDSNGEDLEGYAGAGLYDSVLMDKAEEVVLDYSNDRIIIDKAFQVSLFSKIAEVGKIIEGLYGCPQDIEGVVKGGEVCVVQTRPQIMM